MYSLCRNRSVCFLLRKYTIQHEHFYCSSPLKQWATLINTYHNNNGPTRFHCRPLFTGPSLQNCVIKGQETVDKRDKLYSSPSEDSFEEFERPSSVDQLSSEFGDPDEFGCLTPSQEWRDTEGLLLPVFEDESKVEEGESEEVEREVYTGVYHNQYWFHKQVKNLAKAGKLDEAVEMFENQMLIVESVRPKEHNYTVLIGACARAGHTDKCLQLHRDMKKRGLVPSLSTFTSMFNALANSPDPDTDRMYQLRDEMMTLDLSPNTPLYHAMIKSYACAGDLDTALQLYYSAKHANCEISPVTYSHLMMACVADKKEGFLKIIQVWRLMVEHGMKPTVFHFNLLLRVVRDCELGDPDRASNILLNKGKSTSDTVLQPSRRPTNSNRRTPSHPSRPTTTTTTTDPSNSSVSVSSNNEEPWWQCDSDGVRVSNTQCNTGNGLPSLLDSSSSSSIVGLNNILYPHQRLAMIGGVHGVINRMVSEGVCPDVRTATLLLESLDRTKRSEEQLMRLLNKHKIGIDIDFYNSLIRRRAIRGKYSLAKKVVDELMKEQGFSPNLRTFCNLAIGCVHEEDGLRLLGDISSAGLEANVYVYGALISAACRREDYHYLIQLLKKLHHYKIDPNHFIIQHLEDVCQSAKHCVKNNVRYNTSKKCAAAHGFLGYYKQWLEIVPLAR